MATVFLDFGNVVGFFDHTIAVRRLAAYTDAPEGVIAATLYNTYTESDYESGAITTAEFIAAGREHCRLRCTDEEFLAAFGEIFTPNDAVCALVPRIKAAGHRLFLASNTCEGHALTFRRQFGDTLAHFDGLVLSYEVRARKPGRSFFEAGQRLAGAPATDCVFVDDLAANVAGAEELGWRGIVYSPEVELAARLREVGVAVD